MVTVVKRKSTPSPQILATRRRAAAARAIRARARAGGVSPEVQAKRDIAFDDQAEARRIESQRISNLETARRKREVEDQEKRLQETERRTAIARTTITGQVSR